MAKVKYNRAKILAEVNEWIADGKTLRDFCRQEGKPCRQVIYAWLDEDAEATRHFARARDEGHDVIAEEALEIIDNEPSFGEKGYDSAHVSWAKNRAEIRLKLLAKWNPKKYGDQTKAIVANEEGESFKTENAHTVAVSPELRTVLAGISRQAESE